MGYNTGMDAFTYAYYRYIPAEVPAAGALQRHIEYCIPPDLAALNSWGHPWTVTTRTALIPIGGPQGVTKLLVEAHYTPAPPVDTPAYAEAAAIYARYRAGAGNASPSRWWEEAQARAAGTR